MVKSKSAVKAKEKDYKFSIKLYPDCTEYNCDDVLDNLKPLFAEWVWVLHDKDQRVYPLSLVKPLSENWKNFIFQIRTSDVRRGIGGHLKKPHIHFYGCNNHNKQFSLGSLIRSLQIPYKYSINHDFEYATNWVACVLYSIHRNAPDKYQYPFSAIHTNINNIEQRYFYHNVLADQLDIVCQIIEDAYCKKCWELTYFQLVRLLNNRGMTIHLIKPLLVKDLLYSYRHPDII